MRRRSLTTAFVSSVVASVVCLTGGTAAASPEAPPAPAGSSSAALAWPVPPAGANDWTCRPTADRPHPAVIVHGTFGDAKSLLDPLSWALKQDGYCVYSLDYGNRGTGPIEQSAAELDAFVDRVLASTGAARVQMVGHSQGGMMPRYWIKNLGGDGLVEDLVGLAPSHHGTTINTWLTLSPLCVACDQQRAGSAFLTALNSPDETPGDVDYTQVTTRFDEVVVPYTSGFLADDARSTNITLQDRCPLALTEHLLIPMDRQAIGWVLHAFEREGPADPAHPIGCFG